VLVVEEEVVVDVVVVIGDMIYDLKHYLVLFNVIYKK